MKQALILAVTCAAVQISAHHATALTSFTYTGTTYSQNFDTLPYNTDGTDVVLSNTPIINGTTYTLPAAATPFDLSTSVSTSPITALTGWYGVGAVKDAYSANGGDNTQGGIYAFGVPGSPSRSLGLIAAINGNTTHTGNLIINGVIYGFADLNISNSPTAGGGSGDVTLNAQNHYTGITMDNSNNSTLYLGIDNALPVGTDLVFGTLTGFGAPTVDLNGHNQTVNSLSWGGVGAANAVLITNTGTANSVLTVGSPASTTTPGADFGGLLADGADRLDGTTPRTQCPRLQRRHH